MNPGLRVLLTLIGLCFVYDHHNMHIRTMPTGMCSSLGLGSALLQRSFPSSPPPRALKDLNGLKPETYKNQFFR